MRVGALVRFGLEAIFIVAALVIARAADLKTVWIILVGLLAWLLTALAESLFASGWQAASTFVPPVRPLAPPFERKPAAVAPPPAPPAFEAPASPPEEIAPEWLESAEVLGVHVAGFEPVLPEQEDEAAEEETPADDATLVEAIAPIEEPETEAQEEQALVVASATEALRRRPARSRLPKRLAAPRRRRPAAIVDPAPVFEPPPVPEPAALRVQLDPGAEHEWSVSQLETLARRMGGHDAARDEEWAFLLVYLREFANPEGVLPADFDALVRESLPELVSVAETT